MSGQHEEPSLIYTKNQRFQELPNIRNVERPPYFPSYLQLTPEQKWVYIQLLINPYNSVIDIGYVFILYYGLERHLLIGDFEEAFKVILKLRDVHTNSSFQNYSANAVILSCMMHKRGDLILEFLRSIDKEHEFNFSDNLFLLCYYEFGIPLSPKDIMRMAKTFEWTNTNYIKKQARVFLENLTATIHKKLNTDKVFLHDYITKTELRKIKMEEQQVYANMSIIDQTIPVPQISKNFKLKKEMNIFLENAHEMTKKQLAEMRKKNKTS